MFNNFSFFVSYWKRFNKYLLVHTYEIKNDYLIEENEEKEEALSIFEINYKFERKKKQQFINIFHNRFTVVGNMRMIMKC